MTRLQRLRQIRRVELDRGLRGLAQAEARCGQLAGMQDRLAELAAGLPAAGTIEALKAIAAGRERLHAAAQQVGGALDAARAQRDAAALGAARLRHRIEVVETAMAATR